MKKKIANCNFHFILQPPSSSIPMKGCSSCGLAPATTISVMHPTIQPRAAAMAGGGVGRYQKRSMIPVSAGVN